MRKIYFAAKNSGFLKAQGRSYLPVSGSVEHAAVAAMIDRRLPRAKTENRETATMSRTVRARVSRRQNAASGAPHLVSDGELLIGATVAIFRFGVMAPPCIEGRAVLLKHIAKARFQVRFLDEYRVKERVVHPDYQRDPERMLEILRDLWRASRTETVSEFFPEENC
jgi:hypothetical protein